MLILLPPSEAKTPPHHGAPLAFNDLVFPELSGERRTMIQELQVVSSLGNAHEVLKVGKTLTEQIEANQHILDAPAAPAWQVYTGVLFDALDYGTLENVDPDVTLVFSALFGVTRLADAIPNYRFPATAKLPGIGNVGTWWRERLTSELDEYVTGPIIDCRSSPYRTFWKPRSFRTVTVDVFQYVNGELKTVSHWAKQTRGFVARHLLQQHAKQPIASLEQAAESVSEIYETELVPPTERTAGSLRIVLS
ncbi:peroxide stress protein YaaA [Yaniella flava]|uniref:Peroxide stress protein YaaA n=1 Tax=Yaniella flava TaxID=287930 RepID=A0ABP5GBL4_9MICC